MHACITAVDVARRYSLHGLAARQRRQLTPWLLLTLWSLLLLAQLWLRSQPAWSPSPSPPSAAASAMALQSSTCQQRYRWHLEKNATQMPAISWRLTALPAAPRAPLCCRGAEAIWGSPRSSRTRRRWRARCRARVMPSSTPLSPPSLRTASWGLPSSTPLSSVATPRGSQRLRRARQRLRRLVDRTGHAAHARSALDPATLTSCIVQ